LIWKKQLTTESTEDTEKGKKQIFLFFSVSSVLSVVKCFFPDLSNETTVSTIAQQISPVLLAHPEIRLAILFGSAASGKERFESDVDLAIDIGTPLSAEEKMTLIGDLAERIGRPIDLIDLRTVGEPLLGQIVVKGIRMVGDDTAYADLIKRHWFEEADFMPYVRRLLAERRNVWIRK
jgi:predicted nucleotidyltransferase